MKERKVAAILALLFGGFGVHRFYLGDIGKGIIFCLLSIVGIGFIIGFIDFIRFITMSDDVFDLKYNRAYLDNPDQYDTDYQRNDWDRSRDRRRRSPENQQRSKYEDYDIRKQKQRRSSTSNAKMNPYKASGIQRYKEYEYEEAIRDFNKVLQTEPNDIAVHFNLVCAYSLLEEKEKALHHLERALDLGFKDFDRIRSHDALAYLRIQDEYEVLERRNFGKAAPQSFANTTPMGDNLLDQIRQLGELREKGLLTDEEFTLQKKKLLG